VTSNPRDIDFATCAVITIKPIVT